MTPMYLRWQALNLIDDAADRARRRYITEIAGQQAVYLQKLQQAQAYSEAFAVDPEAEVPPYIQAEAAELGQAPIVVATEVMGLGQIWNEQVGPAIEGKRIGGKAAVRAAADEDVASVRDAAVAALDAI